MKCLVEVVACTVDDAVQAWQAGAERIELVAAISEGGLTPSIGTLLEVKARVPIPVVAMLRPRGGGFHYSEAEFATMLRDARSLADAGADGLVTGVLDGDQVHVSRVQLLLEAVATDWIFHRAFDDLADPFAGLSVLMDLGIRRVLTSGGKPTALEGADVIRELISQSSGTIEILPGGNVRPENVVDVVRRTGASQVHLGPFVPHVDELSGARYLSLDAEPVREIVRLLE